MKTCPLPAAAPADGDRVDRAAAPTRPRQLAALFLTVITLAVALPAGAQEAAGNNKALRRLQLEVSRAQQEKAALETEKAELAGKLEKAEAENKKLEAQQKAQASAVQGALAREKARAEAAEKQDEAHVSEAKAAQADVVKQANERFDRYEADITSLRKQLADSEARARQLQASVQTLQAEKTQLSSDLGERGESLASCEKKNADLFQLNADLRKRYQDKGFWSLLRGAEPMTGIARVKEQNAMQDIEDKAYSDQVRPGGH